MGTLSLNMPFPVYASYPTSPSMIARSAFFAPSSLALSTAAAVTSAVASIPGIYFDITLAMAPLYGYQTPPVPPAAIERMAFFCARAAPETTTVRRNKATMPTTAIFSFTDLDL